METITIKISDMLKLGISWTEFAEATGYNVYALKEGLSTDRYVEVPISLIRK